MTLRPRILCQQFLFLAAMAFAGGGLFLLSGCSDSATGSGGSAHLSAEQVLEDMVQSYRTAKTYADSGELHMQFNYDTDKAVDERVDFAVSFARPNKLRMHCYQAIVVSDGETLRATIADLPNQVRTVKAPEKLTLDALYSDDALRQALTAQLAGSSPQLALLLGDDFLTAILKEAQPPALLKSESIEGQTCDRVKITSAAGDLIFWVAQQNHVLLRIDFPVAELQKSLEQQVGGPVAGLQLWADLKSGSLNHDIEPVAFQFEAPADAKLVEQFDLRPLMPAPPAPSKLLGQKIGEFTFSRLDGTPVTRESLAGKVAVVDFWATWCGPCLSSLPNLNTVYEKFKNDDRIEFLAVSIDRPEVAVDTIKQTFTEIGAAIPISRDTTQTALATFAVEGIPNMFVLGPDGTVEDNEVGLNPELAQELPARLEKLLSGESIHADALKRYEQRKQQYDAALRQPLPASTDQATGEPAKVEIAAKTAPEKLTLTELWTNKELQRPGNLVVAPSPTSAGLLVQDGWRKVVELDDQGKIAAQHDLKTPEMSVISAFRAVTAADGRRWFVGSASTQRQLHLFDDSWNLVLSYPHDDQAEVADVELIDLDGDQTPEIAISYWGNRGLEVISLEGQSRWKNQTLENVFRLAQGPADVDGKRPLFVTHGRGSIATFSADGAPGKELTVGQRFIRAVFAADLDADGQPELVGLSPVDQSRDLLVGFDAAGKELWTYELPAGLHDHPIEHITSGKLLGSTGNWIACAADGSIHILAADGSLLDRFNYGSPLTGIATTQIGGKPALVVSTPTAVTAYEVEAR